jgi:hypothetical protein
MKINNLHLINQDKKHLELVLNEINTTKTIFKNRVSFIALSENQKLILEVIESVEHILDYNIFKIDVIYSLMYKEIEKICVELELILIYSRLKEIIDSIYSGKSDYPNADVSSIFYYIIYLKNI